MLKSRKEVSPAECWNVEAIYSDFPQWQKTFDQTNQENKWEQLLKFKGNLGQSPELLKECLDTTCQIERNLSKLYTFAHLKHDEDIAEESAKQAYQRALTLIHEFHEFMSWFEPELLALPDATIQSFLKSSTLKDYRFHLEKIFRLKPHTLSADKEELLAMASRALQTSNHAFSALNDADFKFGTVVDAQGNIKDLTHATFSVYLRDQDRILRQNTFLKMHGHFLNFENTLTELISGEMQKHSFNARARQYGSCLEAALFPKNIDTTVYHALVKSVNENLDALHDYIKLRQKILNIKPLHVYDLYVPLTAQVDITMPYKEAEEAVIASVAPLGKEYQNLLREGLAKQRWVDPYENKNKRSGAYSSGCYDSMPYILMNYKDQIRDVFTLAHEAGHSMHSLLSHKHQPYQYGDYSIFLAEVASTFNEDLLTRYLLERASSRAEKIFLINQKIEDIRTTFFRQTMFAEFELWLHETAEKNIPLTPSLLKEQYRTLNERYFGTSVKFDPEAEIEWARIPHFYYNFYVYQYATGISAALALSEKVQQGGDREREAYLSFLKGGSSLYPIEMLQRAGVDMRTAHPVEATIRKFRALVKELDRLMQEDAKEQVAVYK